MCLRCNLRVFLPYPCGVSRCSERRNPRPRGKTATSLAVSSTNLSTVVTSSVSLDRD